MKLFIIIIEYKNKVKITFAILLGWNRGSEYDWTSFRKSSCEHYFQHNFIHYLSERIFLTKFITAKIFTSFKQLRNFQRQK